MRCIELLLLLLLLENLQVLLLLAIRGELQLGGRVLGHCRREKLLS